MGLFKWLTRAVRIDQVPVPENTVTGTEPYLPLYVSMFVHHVLGTAMYLPAEVPREVLLAAYVNNYVGDVNNGGHYQFAGNFEWDEEVRELVREGLATLGLEEAMRIFAELEAYARPEPDPFPGGPMDPFLNELDTRFYNGVGKAIEAANTAWIKTRPWLRPVPQEEYFQTMRIPDHPLREARLEQRRRQNEPALRAALLRLRESLNRKPRKP